MSLAPGTRVGPYEVIVLIGVGGMGEVYRARDTTLGRAVALKVLPDAFAHDPERLQRFEREARALALLNHSNIAQVFGFERSDTVRAIAMELVEGRSLDECREMSTDEILGVARQIAAALEAAHDHGIIHRDLKPANIRMREDGTVKVLDFGLAKAWDPGGSPDADPSSSPTITSPATGLGMILGTAAYMSPEQARGRVVDRRADIWAFGVVLFEMLTRARLFDGETVSDTLAAVLRQDVPWDRLPPDTPPRLRHLLGRCLERDPQRRLRDAGDVRLEIEEILEHPLEPAAADVRADVAAHPAHSRAERLIWMALLVAAAGAGWWAARATGESTPPAWAQFTQLTDEAGAEDTPSVSPDGDSVAYARLQNGSWDIYVRRIGGRNATVVAGDPARDESAPAFSPDGRQIAFHESDADGGIFIVGATGESVRRLTQAGFHPAWSPDGREIAFCDERIGHPASRTATSALSIVDVSTGAARTVFAGDAVQPAWSPSGRRLTFWAQRQGQRDLFTIATSGGEPSPVTNDAALDWSVTWSPDGRHLYFASDRGGVMNLWRVGIDEASGTVIGVPEPVTSGVQAWAERPTLSRDGSKLVFRASNAALNPAVFPFDPAAERVGEPAYLVQRTGVLAPRDVSPDGQWLLLSNTGAAVEDIFISRVDGSDLRRVTDDPFRDRAPVWSPDGSQIVFYSNRGGQYQLWSIRPDGSALTALTSGPDQNLWYPFFENAGRLWAFDSRRRAARTFDLGGSLPTEGVEVPPMLVEGGLFRAHSVSRDGTKLGGVLLSREGSRFGAGWHDRRTGETRVLPSTAASSAPVWLSDGRRLLYVADQAAFSIVDSLTGRHRTITGPWPFLLDRDVVALAPDNRAIFVGASTRESDIWMVERQRR